MQSLLNLTIEVKFVAFFSNCIPTLGRADCFVKRSHVDIFYNETNIPFQRYLDYYVISGKIDKKCISTENHFNAFSFITLFS